MKIHGHTISEIIKMLYTQRMRDRVWNRLVDVNGLVWVLDNNDTVEEILDRLYPFPLTK